MFVGVGCILGILRCPVSVLFLDVERPNKSHQLEKAIFTNIQSQRNTHKQRYIHLNTVMAAAKGSTRVLGYVIGLATEASDEDMKPIALHELFKEFGIELRPSYLQYYEDCLKRCGKPIGRELETFASGFHNKRMKLECVMVHPSIAGFPGIEGTFRPIIAFFMRTHMCGKIDIVFRFEYFTVEDVKKHRQIIVDTILKTTKEGLQRSSMGVYKFEIAADRSKQFINKFIQYADRL